MQHICKLPVAAFLFTWYEAEVKSGWLHKQDPSKFSMTWKRRYWVLRSSSLAYYRSEDRAELLKTVPMGDVQEVGERKKPTVHGSMVIHLTLANF